MSSAAINAFCPVCDEPAHAIDFEINSYKVGVRYKGRLCQYCDLQYIEDMKIPDDLYDQIYKNASNLPGYRRYSYYQSQVAKRSDPLRWLGEQEPAYWFIRAELEKLQKYASILEIGSGLGYLSFSIKQSGYNITGIDISDQAVSSARALFGDMYACKDLFSLAAEPTRYDVVILTEVIEHVSVPVDFLKAASAVLKPGGRILMTTPNKSASKLDAYWGTENPPVHLWWFSEAAVRQLARRAALTVSFCDFTAMNTGQVKRPFRTNTIGLPAWLDTSGKVTEEAKRWLISDEKKQNIKRKLQNLSPKIYQLLLNRRHKINASSVAAERSWQIGAVMGNRL